MCDRCELDMLMYGEPVRHEPPVWEKGRFQARPVKTAQEEAAASNEADAGAQERSRRTDGGEQE